jgi:hypothetical protein
MMSTAVVRGMPVESDAVTGSGAGDAAMRVLAGDGTVMVCVWVTVWVSYAVPGTKGGRAWKKERVSRMVKKANRDTEDQRKSKSRVDAVNQTEKENNKIKGNGLVFSARQTRGTRTPVPQARTKEDGTDGVYGLNIK